MFTDEALAEINAFPRWSVRARETGSAGKTGGLPKGNCRGNQGHRIMNQQFSFCDGWCDISCS